jgi:hypothetical protein
MTVRLGQPNIRRIGTVTVVYLVLLLLGCASTGDSAAPASHQAPAVPTTTRAAGQPDYLSGQAGSMAEEDATHAKPAPSIRDRSRPEPIRPEHNSPVNQPRIR